MRDFFEIMEKDIMKENFNKVEAAVYCTVVITLMFGIMVLAGLLETVCE